MAAMENGDVVDFVDLDVPSDEDDDDDDSEVSDDGMVMESPARVRRSVRDATDAMQQEMRASVMSTSRSVPRNPTTNPSFSNRTRLWSRTHHYIGVYADGTVKGTEDKADLHTHLELISTSYPGHLWIRGLLCNMFVAMNAKGRIYAATSSSDENTIFIEGVIGSYLTYLNRQHAAMGWYLGINKRGKMKNGKKTAIKQKAVHYLKVRRGVE